MSENILTSDEELHQLQRVCLEMLLEVDRICRKNKIEYSLDGGSLLGMARHGGFIPWDDDVDIIFMRDQYEKFRTACESDLDTSRFFLQDYTTDPEYRWGYAKLRRKNTVQIRRGQEHIKQQPGVFIDLFVMDNVPDNPVQRRLHHFYCFCLRKILYSPVGVVNEKSGFMRCWYKLLSHISRDKVFAARDRLAKKWNKRKTELVIHYTFPLRKKCRYGLPSECFDSFIDVDFEGYTVRAFEKYDLYLSRHYGNYMQLPPEEERVPHLEFSKMELIDVDAKLRIDR